MGLEPTAPNQEALTEAERSWAAFDGRRPGELAVIEMNDLVGIVNQAAIVGNHQDRGAETPRAFLEQLDDGLAVAPVQGAGGLVGKAQHGLLDQGPANRYPLLFSARQLDGQLVALAAEVEQVQHLGHLLAGLPR